MGSGPDDWIWWIDKYVFAVIAGIIFAPFYFYVLVPLITSPVDDPIRASIVDHAGLAFLTSFLLAPIGLYLYEEKFGE